MSNTKEVDTTPSILNVFGKNWEPCFAGGVVGTYIYRDLCAILEDEAAGSHAITLGALAMVLAMAKQYMEPTRAHTLLASTAVSAACIAAYNVLVA